jgi:hypothetical protein
MIGNISMHSFAGGMSNIVKESSERQITTASDRILNILTIALYASSF